MGLYQWPSFSGGFPYPLYTHIIPATAARSMAGNATGYSLVFTCFLFKLKLGLVTLFVYVFFHRSQVIRWVQVQVHGYILL